MKSTEEAAEEAAKFIQRTTEDPPEVLHIGPARQTWGDQEYSATLFVSSALAREMFEADQWVDQEVEHVCQGPLRSILTTCLEHQVRAVTGGVDGVQADDYEKVAEHVARVGVGAASSENVGYRGYLRLVQLEPDETPQGMRFWYVLCKGEQAGRDETTTLQLSMTLRGCRPKEAEGGELFRPLGRLLERSGGPPGELSFVFAAPRLADQQDVTIHELDEVEDSEYPEEGIRYLGCVSLTTGGMLSFFPGLPRAPFALVKTDGDVHEHMEEARLDHLTLEPDRQEWHITGYTQDGDRVGRRGFRTREVTDGLVHWFSLGLASAEALYKMRERNHIEIEVPARDEGRRRRISYETITSANYALTSVGDARLPESESFWYIEVHVATEPGATLPKDEFYGRGRVGESELSPGSPIDVATRRVPVGDGAEELLFLSTRLPGRLDADVEIGFPTVRPVQ